MIDGFFEIIIGKRCVRNVMYIPKIGCQYEYSIPSSRAENYCHGDWIWKFLNYSSIVDKRICQLDWITVVAMWQNEPFLTRDSIRPLEFLIRPRTNYWIMLKKKKTIRLLILANVNWSMLLKWRRFSSSLAIGRGCKRGHQRPVLGWYNWLSRPSLVSFTSMFPSLCKTFRTTSNHRPPRKKRLSACFFTHIILWKPIRETMF